MVLTILAGVTLILCFMSAVNFYFQKQKYKYATEDVMKKVPFFEAPSTWSFFTILLGFVLVFFICLSIWYMGKGLNDFSNQKNTINQYQEDSTSQSTDSEQSTSTSK
jgi:hypothetical protein